MATYVTLIRLTEQGVREIRDTCDRASAFQARVEKAGVTVREVLWTTGAFDGLLVVEAADDETVSGAMLSLAAQGHVRTETCRAFTAEEMAAILKDRLQ